MLQKQKHRLLFICSRIVLFCQHTRQMLYCYSLSEYSYRKQSNCSGLYFTFLYLAVVNSVPPETRKINSNIFLSIIPQLTSCWSLFHKSSFAVNLANRSIFAVCFCSGIFKEIKVRDAMQCKSMTVTLKSLQGMTWQYILEGLKFYIGLFFLCRIYASIKKKLEQLSRLFGHRSAFHFLCLNQSRLQECHLIFLS